MGFHVLSFSNALRLLGLDEEAAAWRAHLEVLPLADWLQYLAARPDKQLRLLRERAAGMSDEEVLDVSAMFGLRLMYAEASGGEYERPIHVIESMVHAPGHHPERSAVARILLAKLYMEVNREDESAALLEELADELEAKVRTGDRASAVLGSLAWVYALQGHNDAALTMFEMRAENDGQPCGHRWFGWFWGLNDENLYDKGPNQPHLTWGQPDSIQDLRAQPRYKKLLRECEQEIERQAVRIRTMLAEHELEDLLAPMIEYRSVQGL